MKIGPLQINFRRIGVFVIIAVVIIIVMNFNLRMEELSHLLTKSAVVQGNATEVVVTQHALQTQVAQATSPAEVEKYAREQAHMAQPGDKVIVILPAPGATAPATPIPTPVISNRTKLDVWVDFIFGK